MNIQEKSITSMDLQKVFVKLNYKQLFNILLDLGVIESVQDLMSYYPLSTSQRVRIGNQISSLETIGVGVPQDSVLRPLL